MQTNYLKEWETIASAGDIAKAFIQHFSYLVQKSTDHRLLERIAAKASRVAFDEKNLTISFEGTDEKLVATPPLLNIPDHYPATFKAILSKHATVDFFEKLGEDNGANIDGYIEGLEGVGEIGKEFSQAKDLVCPINEYGAPVACIYHPFRKKENGVPYLYFIHLHDPPEIHSLGDDDAGTSFLRTIAHVLEVALD